MRELVAVMVVLLLTLTVSHAVNITTNLVVEGQWGDNWQGRFCFNLPDPIASFVVEMTFNIPVKEIRQQAGEWVEEPISCGRILTLTNQGTGGAQPAGQFCVNLRGKLCIRTALSAVATLTDQPSSIMMSPSFPRINALLQLMLGHQLPNANHCRHC